MKKTEGGEYQLVDSFINPSATVRDASLKVYGYSQSFALTTGYIPSKKIRLEKEDVTELWQQLKKTKNLWAVYDNHRDDLPPIGYIRQAALLETDKWSGIFVVVAFTCRDAFDRTKSGQLTGLSVSFRIKSKQARNLVGKPKLASLELEANSYSPTQIEDFKKAFSPEYGVVCNEVYKFSEAPPLVIKILIDLDVQNVVTLLISKPKESALILGAGVVTVEVIKLVVQDVYNFVKNTAKKLFDNKDKRRPIILTEIGLLGKKVRIKNSSGSEEGLIRNMEKVEKYIQNLSKSDLTKISTANEVAFSIGEGELRIYLNTEIYKTIKLRGVGKDD